VKHVLTMMCIVKGVFIPISDIYITKLQCFK